MKTDTRSNFLSSGNLALLRLYEKEDVVASCREVRARVKYNPY
jgi:hypothetical protein